jgi:hypothetical protein
MHCRSLVALVLFLVLAAISGCQVGTPLGGQDDATYSDPVAYCSAVGTIDTADERYVGAAMPDSIVQAMIAQGILAADAPAEFAENAVWRCMDGSVWFCHFGANLPCQEKADDSREPSEAMQEFCEDNPTADVIPAAVTGRATVYEWACADGEPQVVRQVFTADPEGYLAEFWYKLDTP